MSWFDVAETPDGRSYSVAAYRAGGMAALNGGRPGVVPQVLRILLLPLSWIWAPIVWALGRPRFHNFWTVRVGPWYGRRGKRWKVGVPTEHASDRRAEALFQLIKTGQWDPELEPPPQPVGAD